MNTACTRWVLLSDREALGESLSERDAMFMATHAADCAACGAEAATWHAFGTLMDSNPHHEPTPRRMERVHARPWRGIAVSSFAIACVIALGFFAREPAQPKTQSGIAARAPTVPGPALPASSISIASGLLDVDGRSAEVGRSLAGGALVFARTGVGCLSIEPLVRACLAPRSLVRVIETGATRRLELLSGMVAAALDPQPPSSSFGILTREGSAIAVGTAFSVEVPERGAIMTRVLHGTVLVRGTGGTELRVPAHRAASMDGVVTELSLRDELRERALLPSDATLAVLREMALAEPAPQRDSAPTRSPTGRVPITARSAQGIAATRVDSASELLVKARERAVSGDANGALAAYRALLDRYPRSAETHAASVAYAEMLLGAHGDAETALHVFERYVAAGGPLLVEASFGRARALRALRRTAEERAAITDFLRRFPEGPLATSLRVRAGQLEAQP